MRLRKVFCVSNALVGCGMVDSSKAKESLESRHRLPPAVVSEDELVEVDLELTAAYAVVGANQPLLQVADGSVGQRHDRWGTFVQFRPQRLNAGDMLETHPFQAAERFEPIGVNGRTWGHVLHKEVVDGVGLEVGDDGHAEAPRGFSSPLDGGQGERRPTPLELAASSDTRLGSADPRVVDLDFAPQRFASEVDHRSPKLMEYHPSGFVTSKPKLALEQQRRDTALVGGHQVGCPEPDGQRRLRIMNDGTRGQRDLVTTGGALPASSSNQRVAVTVGAARTDEPLRPAAPSQVFLAGLFGGEFNLKLLKGRRKGRTWHSQIVSLTTNLKQPDKQEQANEKAL